MKLIFISFREALWEEKAIPRPRERKVEAEAHP